MKAVYAIVVACLALQTWNSQSIPSDITTSSIATTRAWAPSVSAPHVSSTIDAHGAAAAHADAVFRADPDDDTVTAGTTPEIGDKPAEADGDVSVDEDDRDGGIAETIDV
jgi:hypothetical protein